MSFFKGFKINLKYPLSICIIETAFDNRLVDPEGGRMFIETP